MRAGIKANTIVESSPLLDYSTFFFDEGKTVLKPDSLAVRYLRAMIVHKIHGI